MANRREELEPDDSQEGKVVSPLPPGKIHSTKGIVTPKLPIEIDRMLGKRDTEVPEEALPNEPEQT